jgi:hypothetical protein
VKKLNAKTVFVAIVTIPCFPGCHMPEFVNNLLLWQEI